VQIRDAWYVHPRERGGKLEHRAVLHDGESRRSKCTREDPRLARPKNRVAEIGVSPNPAPAESRSCGTPYSKKISQRQLRYYANPMPSPDEFASQFVRVHLDTAKHLRQVRVAGDQRDIQLHTPPDKPIR
jgi:hypothetical protein